MAPRYWHARVAGLAPAGNCQVKASSFSACQRSIWGKAWLAWAHPLAGARLRGAALAPARVVGHVVAGECQPGRRGCVAPSRARAAVLLPLAALALAHTTHMFMDKAGIKWAYRSPKSAWAPRPSLAARRAAQYPLPQCFWFLKERGQFANPQASIQLLQSITGMCERSLQVQRRVSLIAPPVVGRCRPQLHLLQLPLVHRRPRLAPQPPRRPPPPPHRRLAPEQQQAPLPRAPPRHARPLQALLALRPPPSDQAPRRPPPPPPPRQRPSAQPRKMFPLAGAQPETQSCGINK